MGRGVREAGAQVAGSRSPSTRPIAGFMGHVERDKKQRMAVGMLDHSAGIAKAAGAEVDRLPPGLPARPRAQGRHRTRSSSSWPSCASGSRERVVTSTSAWRSWDACGSSAARRTSSPSPGALPWVRPVIDFAHLHAVTDGAFTTVKAFHDVLEGREQGAWPAVSRSTSTSRTSPTRTATRRSICPTARARSAPSRSARRSPASRARRP